MRSFLAICAVAAIGFAIVPTSARADDTWVCKYPDFYNDNKGTRESTYQVVGYQLYETTVHVTDQYMLLENSGSTIVAAKAGRFGRDGKVAIFQVMIDKTAGEFLQTMASMGKANARVLGKCKLVHSKD